MPRKTKRWRKPVAARHPRFNEAAARCRGKRPNRARMGATNAGFNEAAARCRGKRSAGVAWASGSYGFNEAAARCRGKPGTAKRMPTFGVALQ